jgi:hypothetical protein
MLWRFGNKDCEDQLQEQSDFTAAALRKVSTRSQVLFVLKKNIQ